MAYSFYLSREDEIIMQFPVAPSKLSIKTANKNTTVDLLEYGEYNILKKAGLSEVDFDILLPATYKPFATYLDGFEKPKYFLDKLKQIKKNQDYVTLTVCRKDTKSLQEYDTATRKLMKNSPAFNTVMLVSLESYTIEEDAKEGMDVVVSLKFKEHKALKTKVKPIKKGGKKDRKSERANEKSQPKSYIVKKGDNLWTICKLQLGDSSKCYEVAKYNNIKNADLIHVGQVIKFP